MIRRVGKNCIFGWLIKGCNDWWVVKVNFCMDVVLIVFVGITKMKNTA